MRIILCLGLLVAMLGIANADVYSDNAKAAQDVADKFFKAIADKDFDAYKAKCSATRVAEYEANNANAPLKKWYDSARNEIDKYNAKWEFKSVKSNMPNSISLDYTRTMSSGATTNTIFLVKEGDKWLVDAAGSI
jgi:hypothetical protein